ncbi:MAG: FHA domain-containing protein, partial [Planctomycetes bacterium]|nr:FHA domain-containing protein [Planctomycetota bacterium]
SPGQLAGVRRAADCIDQVDTLADREEYVLLFRTATIGSAPGAAVQLRGSGVADVHARVLHLGGGFWLEPLWEETTLCANTGEEIRSTRTYVDGRQVARHELVPLAPGMKLRFGETEVTFDEFEQMEL